MFASRRAFLQEKEEQPIRVKKFFTRFGQTAGSFLFLVCCALVTAFLFVYSYPKSSQSLLAWLAFAPFVLGVCSLRSFWKTACYAWLTGLVVYAGLYYWIFVTCCYGGGLSQGLSLAAWLGLSGLMALQFALFGAGCYYLKQLKGFFPLLAAMGWVALEWAHETLATYVLGFPWFTLAYSQWNIPQVLQIASVTGAAGVSFLVAFTGNSVGYALATPSLKISIRQMVLAACVFLITYGAGGWYLKYTSAHNLLRMSVAVMQPNIDQYKKWSAEFEEEIHQTLLHMSEQLKEKGILLVVWPESALPGAVEEEQYGAWLTEMAHNLNAWQLVGTNRGENGKEYVSAYLLNPQGETAGIYDKVHLVPFGETIPFENTLRKLFPNVEVLGELGAFSPGEKEQSLLKLDQILFGSTICYESVFSHLWRQQTRAGARFLTNLTNDAWFFDTAAPYQHFAVSVLRAVENHRPVLRAANTGISAIISARGQILSQAKLNTRAILQAGIDLPLSSEESFYSQWGDWFAYVCVLFYLTALISTMVFMDN